MLKETHQKFFDIIKYPIITDKTTQLIEHNQYSFAVDRKANKHSIKIAIEYLFDIKVCSVNTMHLPIKKRRINMFYGNKARYKKAIITVSNPYAINLLSS